MFPLGTKCRTLHAVNVWHNFIEYISAAVVELNAEIYFVGITDCVWPLVKSLSPDSGVKGVFNVWSQWTLHIASACRFPLTGSPVQYCAEQLSRLGWAVWTSAISCTGSGHNFAIGFVLFQRFPERGGGGWLRNWTQSKKVFSRFPHRGK